MSGADCLRLSTCLVVLLIAGRAVEACSCGGSQDAATAILTADAVFQAKVEEVYTRCHPLRLAWYSVDDWVNELLQYEPSLEKYDKCFGLVATMRVTTAWKGIAGERVRVIGGLGRGDCGFVFRRDVEYLVYGRASESGDLVASICSRTRPVSDAEEDLAILAEWQDRTVTP